MQALASLVCASFIALVCASFIALVGVRGRERPGSVPVRRGDEIMLGKGGGKEGGRGWRGVRGGKGRGGEGRNEGRRNASVSIHHMYSKEDLNQSFRSETTYTFLTN